MAVFSGNGLKSAPSFTFSSDTDTGIFRYGANQMVLVTAGEHALFIDQNRNIAIGGEFLPSEKVDVRGTCRLGSEGTGGGSARNGILIGTVGTNTRLSWQHFGSAAGVNPFFEVDPAVNSTQLFAGTNGSRRASLDSSGNLLIGGTLPGAPNATISSGGGIGCTSIGTGSGTLQQGAIFRRGLSGFSNSDTETRYFKIFELPQLPTGFVIGKLTFYAARGGGNQQRAAKDFYFSVGYNTDGNIYSTIAKSAEGVDAGFTTMTLEAVENGTGTIATVRLALRSSTAALTPFLYAVLEYIAFPLGSGASNVRYVFDGTYTTS